MSGRDAAERSQREAERCRRLAREATDVALKQQLLAIAEQYESEAATERVPPPFARDQDGRGKARPATRFADPGKLAA